MAAAEETPVEEPVEVAEDAAVGETIEGSQVKTESSERDELEAFCDTHALAWIHFTVCFTFYFFCAFFPEFWYTGAAKTWLWKNPKDSFETDSSVEIFGKTGSEGYYRRVWKPVLITSLTFQLVFHGLLMLGWGYFYGGGYWCCCDLRPLPMRLWCVKRLFICMFYIAAVITCFNIAYTFDTIYGFHGVSSFHARIWFPKRYKAWNKNIRHAPKSAAKSRMLSDNGAFNQVENFENIVDFFGGLMN